MAPYPMYIAKGDSVFTYINTLPVGAHNVPTMPTPDMVHMMLIEDQYNLQAMSTLLLCFVLF